MLFGRKKEKQVQEISQESEEIKLPTLDEIKQQTGKLEKSPLPIPKIEEIPVQPVVEKREPEKRLVVEELRMSVPLFIKLERYEEILKTIDELREVLNLIKNSFSPLDESERIRTETVKNIKENIEKIEGKIASLHSKLLKPTGYEEKEEHKSEEVKNAISTLKLQIDKLKQEIQSLE